MAYLRSCLEELRRCTGRVESRGDLSMQAARPAPQAKQRQGGMAKAGQRGKCDPDLCGGSAQVTAGH